MSATLAIVIAGLDPAIHQRSKTFVFAKTMDPRGKPGGDDTESSAEAPP
jgi:hypothetical protein